MITTALTQNVNSILVRFVSSLRAQQLRSELIKIQLTRCTCRRAPCGNHHIDGEADDRKRRARSRVKCVYTIRARLVGALRAAHVSVRAKRNVIIIRPPNVILLVTRLRRSVYRVTKTVFALYVARIGYFCRGDLHVRKRSNGTRD